MTLEADFMLKIIWTILGTSATGLMGLVIWGLKKLIEVFFENTVQLKLLNQHVEKLLELPPKVEKLERDVSAAHEKIRAITKNGENKCDQ